MIRYHGVCPPRRPNQIYVANHTTVLDIIVILYDRIVSLIGQRHTGRHTCSQRFRTLVLVRYLLWMHLGAERLALGSHRHSGVLKRQMSSTPHVRLSPRTAAVIPMLDLARNSLYYRGARVLPDVRAGLHEQPVVRPHGPERPRGHVGQDPEPHQRM